MTDFNALTKGITDCACGRDHSCPVRHVEIGSDALKKLPQLLADYRSILLIADSNTDAACGRAVEAALGSQIAGKVRYETGSQVLIPDENAIETLMQGVTDKVDMILGVGSGVINDLCKHVSYQQGLPYGIVATAPSMDGYASVGAALILKGMKITLNARPPVLIAADTGVLKRAPMEMLRAGFGDIVGKYSCLNDWKLSALLNGESFCQEVYDLVYDTTQQVEGLAAGIRNREEAAVGALMEALVTVGIAMSYVGNSRPASGSEHHLSHYFEITGILGNTPYLPHGIDVIHAAVLTAEIRQQLLHAKPHSYSHDQAAWERAIRRIYLSSAQEVIDLQNKLGWYRQADLQAVEEKWESIRAVLAEAPSPRRMLEMIDAIGLDHDAFLAFYGEEKIADGIRYAKDLKDRYSVLWLKELYFG